MGFLFCGCCKRQVDFVVPINFCLMFCASNFDAIVNWDNFRALAIVAVATVVVENFTIGRVCFVNLVAPRIVAFDSLNLFSPAFFFSPEERRVGFVLERVFFGGGG